LPGDGESFKIATHFYKHLLWLSLYSSGGWRHGMERVRSGVQSDW